MTLPIYFKQEDETFYQDELNQYLQDNLSEEGFVVPPETTANITTLSGDMADGTLWYDSDTDDLKVKINGTVRVVQLV